MREIFVDTAGWGHLVDPNQRFHDLSTQIYREARESGMLLLTSNYVLAELVALLTNPLRAPRARLIAFIDSLKSAEHIEVLHIDAELDQRAWSLLRERQDKSWSLVDCASFVVMNERGIRDAFTSDHHFTQAGFRCLLEE